MSHKTNEPLFRISLAEWSVNKPLFAGEMDHLDFPGFARGLGIEAVEYVNQFFMDRAKDTEYLSEMKTRAQGEGVRSVLIMVDGEGPIGHPDANERLAAVDNHKKWVEAARFLGCHAIRVNGFSSPEWGAPPGDFEEEQRNVADGLRKLCEFAEPMDIDVIIENHGGWSSHGGWLAGVMKLADHRRAGTLPDFGNFRIREGETYDSYDGVAELMPYARGVSVKPNVYDANGNRSELNYERMMRIVLDAGFRGYCGIEHGREGTESEDILRVKRRLEETHDLLAEDY
jgi:sugar phosphate isomerase/epimerase